MGSTQDEGIPAAKHYLLEYDTQTLQCMFSLYRQVFAIYAFLRTHACTHTHAHTAFLIILITCLRVPVAVSVQNNHPAKGIVASKPLEASAVQYVL